MVKTKGTKDRKTWRIIVLSLIGVLAAIGITMGLFFSSHPTWIGEQPSQSNYVHRMLGLVSDMPHMTGELFFDAVENSVTFIVIGGLALRKLRKEHADFDRAHGIVHEHEEKV